MNDLSVPPMNGADPGAGTDRMATTRHASDLASLKGRLLKNTAYPLPLLGAIRMGGIEVIDDRRLPVKDDAFSITTQARDADGGWVLHPLHQLALEAQQGRPGQAAPKPGAQAKLRAIPVRVMFDATDLTVRESYEAFDKDSGRPLCRGDGERARRVVGGVASDEACPTPEHCEFGKRNRCKHFARVSLQIEGQTDALATFILRTTGYNTARTVRAKLEMISALTGGRLRGLPFWLVMRAKCSRLSKNAPFYYADLELGCSMEEVAARLTARRQADEAGGFNVAAFEHAVRTMLNNSAFEDAEDDLVEFEDLLIDPSDGRGAQGATGGGSAAGSQAQSTAVRTAAAAPASERAAATIAKLSVTTSPRPAVEPLPALE